MKLLTRYSSRHANTSTSSLTLQQPIAVKRPPRVIRIPYYLLLVAIAAVYYGYVISVNLGFIGSRLGRTSLACTFMLIFHVLYGLMTWSLVVTANRGPGAVGEILLDATGYDVERQRSRSSTSLLPGDESHLLAPFELASTSTVDLHAGASKRPTSGHGPDKQRFRANSSVSVSSSDSEADGDDFGRMLKRLAEEGDDEEGDSIELIRPTTFNGVKLRHTRRVSDEVPPQSNSSTLTAKANGRARFCRKCKLPKPDRAHHCSTCGFCVLKMDHHCPWIGGCVGFKNYKAFILFLLYADLLALFTAGTSLWTLLQTMDMDVETLGLAPVGWGFLVLFGFLFSMMLSGFFPYHLYLTINNRTTIENMERNGRLLSLPPRAESFVSAGTLEPSDASLPSHPKTDHANRLSVNHDLRTPSSIGSAGDIDAANPFLPPQASATFSLPSRAASSTPLSRYQRRNLEQTAGKINMYDLGTASANFCEAFGAEWTSWRAWLPIGLGRGTGYEYPVNKAKFVRLQRVNELLTRQSSGTLRSIKFDDPLWRQ